MQNSWYIVVFFNGYLIGPYFFEENVNRQNFLSLLRDILPQLLENVDLATRLRMWIQLDGAPSHYAHIVCNYLNTHYNGKWIGRVVAWPLSSPDLTSPDFYLWGYLKNAVYAQRPTTRDNMMERIRIACAAIPRDVLLGTIRQFRVRLDLCIQQNGGNFEQLIRG